MALFPAGGSGARLLLHRGPLSPEYRKGAGLDTPVAWPGPALCHPVSNTLALSL